MSNVGSAAAGKVLTATGNASSPLFQSIGTNSGLTQHGVLISEGNSPFSSTASGATGTVLIGNTGADPTFSATPTLTSVKFGVGSPLDTYLVGAYIPSLTGGTTPPTVSYSVQNGRYTRIGDRVICDISILLSSISGGSGNVNISLPFTCNATTEGIGSCYVENLTFTGDVSVRAVAGTNILQMMVSTSGAPIGVVQISALSNTFHISCTIIFGT